MKKFIVFTGEKEISLEADEIFQDDKFLTFKIITDTGYVESVASFKYWIYWKCQGTIIHSKIEF